jgi:WD40 repeat protein
VSGKKMGLKSLFRSIGKGRRRRSSTSIKQQPDNDHDDPQTSSGSSLSVITIPPSIWIDHIFGFLDRKTQNRLCIASKDVHDGIQKLQIQQHQCRQWPHDITFRIKKILIAVCFSPTSNELAFVTSNSKVVTVWNNKQGFEQKLEGHQGQCSDVTYSDDFLVSSSRTDGTVRLWVRRGCGDHKYWNYRILNVRVFDTLFVRVSSDGQKIASFGDDGKIYLSNSKTGELIASTLWRDRNFIDCYACVAFPKRTNRRQQHNTMLAHTFNNQTVKLWNWETQTRISLDDNDPTRLTDYKAYITSIQFVPTSSLEGADPAPTDGGGRSSRSSSSKPEFLVVGCAVARVKLWSLEDYTCIRTFHLGSGWSAVTHLVFNKEGTRMACTGDGSQIRIFDVATGECLQRQDGHKNKVNTLCFSPDGSTLASGSNDRTLRLHAVP